MVTEWNERETGQSRLQDRCPKTKKVRKPTHINENLNVNKISLFRPKAVNRKTICAAVCLQNVTSKNA